MGDNELGKEFKEIKVENSVESDGLLNDKYISDLKNVMLTGSTVPTYIPKKLVESYYFYKNGVDQRLYVYIDNTWTYVSVTGTITGQHAVGSGSHSSGTANESFTCGFQPTVVKITALPAGNFNSSSVGLKKDGEAVATLLQYSNGGTFASGLDSSSIIVVWNNSLSANTVANFVSFDATGFTIDWTADGVSINYIWEAWS